MKILRMGLEKRTKREDNDDDGDDGGGGGGGVESATAYVQCAVFMYIIVTGFV